MPGTVKDGEICLLEQPLDLPEGSRVLVTFLDAPAPAMVKPVLRRSEKTGMWVLCFPPGTPRLTSEEVAKALEDFP